MAWLQRPILMGRLSAGRRTGERWAEMVQIAGKHIPTGSRKLLPVFCVGMLAGILTISIGKSTFLEETGLFDKYILSGMKHMTVDNSALFYYVLRKRLSLLLVVAVLATTYLGYAVCVGAAAWCGMSVGTYLSALVLRYGLKGLVLAAAGMFPQYLLFVPAILMMLGWCEGLYRGIYARGSAAEAVGRSFVIGKLGWLGVIGAVVVAGCFLESYVNPVLLLGYLKIF